MTENYKLTIVSAFRDLISPHADTGFPIVSETGAALVAGGFTVPAVPEHVAFGGIRENTVQPFAVSSRDWRFCERMILRVS